MWMTALILGAAGSLHCLGMCSPLAMTVTSLRKPFFINRMVYNTGRIVSYGIMGAVIGSFGSLFHFDKVQHVLSIVLGSVLIFFGMAGINSLKIPFITRAMQWSTLSLKKMFSKFLANKSIGSITMMGMLNGLLPCGLTYLALSYCAVLPSARDGFFFMIIFGLGTFPVMLGLTSVVQTLINRYQISFRKLTTAMMITLGVLLISRSLYVHHQHHEPLNSEIVDCR